MQSTPPDTRLVPLAAADCAAVARLAHAIWHEHYPAIIGRDQIDYMLARRCSATALGRYLAAADRWFDLLWVGGRPVGYVSHALAEAAGELRLEQLYLASGHRGRGLGRLMLAHVEAHACELGREMIVLQVNRRNASAIAFYGRAGFAVRGPVVADIGAGFVMDDFVMAKPLGGAGPVSRHA